MKRGLDWYKRDPIAFLDGVQGLGPEAIGAYAVLLDLVYARAGATPRDDRHLAGILGCSVRKATALTDRLIEAGKLTIRDGFIVNSRAETEAKSRRDERETRAKAGRIGAEKRWGSSENNDLGMAHANGKAMPEKRESKSKIDPPHPPLEAEVVSGADRADAAGETGGEKARRSQPKPRRARATYPERFERFWTAYPRKAGKAAAFEAWAKFDEEAQECALLAAPEFAADMAKEERPPDKIPHAATWINQQRFTDYYTPEYDDAPQGKQQAESIVDGEDGAIDGGDVQSGSEELGSGDWPVRDAEPAQSRALEGVGGVAPVLSPPRPSVVIDYEERRARAVASRKFCGSDDVSVGFDRRSTVRAVGEFLSQLDPDAEHLAAAPSRAGASGAAGGRRH